MSYAGTYNENDRHDPHAVMMKPSLGTFNKEIAAVENQLKNAQKRIRDARKLHVRANRFNSPDVCKCDDELWPCGTYLALEGLKKKLK